MGMATSKVRLNICGSSYVVNTSESEDYMQNLADRLNLDMNEYMLDQYPQAYKVATDICKNLEGCIGHKLDETETGYLAMHIQRVYKDAV